MKSEGMSTVNVLIEGVAPLLMHNARLANPADPIVREIKSITGKHHTKKTETDELRLIELEFLGGLYENEVAGVHVPGVNVEGCLRDGARISSKGKTIESGAQVDPEFIPLIYDGPKTGIELYRNKRFVDTRATKLQKSSTIMRTRPRFDQWALEFELTIIDEVVSRSEVKTHLEKAGMLKGLCDFKPKFGRFIVKRFKWF
jgi:hypothetical protein